MTRVLDELAHPALVDRIFYATITLMSVLFIYDGWQTLKLIDVEVEVVIVGPIIAMFAHVFSAAMAKHVEAGRVLIGGEWRAIVHAQAPFLVLASLRSSRRNRHDSVWIRRLAQ